MTHQGLVFRGVFVLSSWGAVSEEASKKTQPWLKIRSLLSRNTVVNRLEGTKM